MWSLCLLQSLNVYSKRNGGGLVCCGRYLWIFHQLKEKAKFYSNCVHCGMWMRDVRTIAAASHSKRTSKQASEVEPELTDVWPLWVRQWCAKYYFQNSILFWKYKIVFYFVFSKYFFQVFCYFQNTFFENIFCKGQTKGKLISDSMAIFRSCFTVGYLFKLGSPRTACTVLLFTYLKTNNKLECKLVNINHIALNWT